MNFLQDHIALCRSYINEINEGESDWTDAEIVTYIDAENKHLSAVIRDKNQDFFGFRSIFPLVSGQSEYFFPKTLAHLRFVEMIKSGVSGSAPNYVVDEMNRDWTEIRRAQGLRDLYSENYFRSNRRRYSSEQFVLYDNKMIFSPGTSLSGYIRLWFVRTLPKLHYGTVVSATASTVILSATPTEGVLQKEQGIYEGSLIGIFSGTGDGQVRRITNYDAITRVATLDEDFLVTPTGASIYSLISPVPEQMQELLPLGAAIRATGKMNDDQSRFYNLYTQILRDFLVDINPRDRTDTRRVRRTR